MGQAWSLALFIGVPMAQGVLGAFTTRQDTKEWLPRLKRPKWQPPDWVFGPVWTTLYTTMGIASWLVYREGGLAKQALPLGLYGAHLIFNFAWTPIFFKAHKPGWALADITAMLGFSVLATIEFFKVNRVAGSLMVPYLGWQVFAAALNYRIWRDNPKGAGDEPLIPSEAASQQHQTKMR